MSDEKKWHWCNDCDQEVDVDEVFDGSEVTCRGCRQVYVVVARFQEGWAAILARGEEYERRCVRAAQLGDQADQANRSAAVYRIAMTIVARWRTAGYPSASLVEGLPVPERAHVAGWQGEGRFRKCGVCGRSNAKRPESEICDGPSAFDLIYDAVARGVPFGLRLGFPTAGEPHEPGDVVEKLARATCRPRRAP